MFNLNQPITHFYILRQVTRNAASGESNYRADERNVF